MVRRKAPVMRVRDGAGAFQQIARPGVVAEPCPGGHHLRVLRRGQVACTVGQRAVKVS